MSYLDMMFQAKLSTLLLCILFLSNKPILKDASVVAKGKWSHQPARSLLPSSLSRRGGRGKIHYCHRLSGEIVAFIELRSNALFRPSLNRSTEEESLWSVSHSYSSLPHYRPWPYFGIFVSSFLMGWENDILPVQGSPKKCQLGCVNSPLA